MKTLITLFVCCVALVSSAVGQEKLHGHLIPADSKSEYDFRGEPSAFLMGSRTAKHLQACKTYEELRNTLKIVLQELYASGV